MGRLQAEIGMQLARDMLRALPAAGEPNQPIVKAGVACNGYQPILVIAAIMDLHLILPFQMLTRTLEERG
jgi:hypothetical protein